MTEHACNELDTHAVEDAPASAPRPIAGRSAGLAVPKIASFDAERRAAVVVLGGAEVTALIDDAVESAVLATAVARGERVVVDLDGGAPTIVGVLRTTATPGVDTGDDFTIRARRIAIEGAHEVSLRVGASSLVMRALGHVEIASKTLVARAEGAQRFFARMIHMN